LLGTIPLYRCDEGIVFKPRFFTPIERAALAALADAVLPKDDAPGGSDLGTVPYVEQMLTVSTFFAGGPFSGRQPYADGSRPPNDFANFLELDRVQTLAAKKRIADLQKQLKDGLAAAIASAPGPIDKLSQADIVEWFRDQSAGFRALLVELVSQAAFAAPEYGGNVGLAGWKLANYEGDSQPLGYSIWDDAKKMYRERPEAPMSTANPGPDPAPLDADVRMILDRVTAALGGKKFP